MLIFFCSNELGSSRKDPKTRDLDKQVIRRLLQRLQKVTVDVYPFRDVCEEPTTFNVVNGNADPVTQFLDAVRCSSHLVSTVFPPQPSVARHQPKPPSGPFF